MTQVLVTAGPTREHIDDVRFISNASSGRMGYAVARAAAAAGHRVVLISGPVERTVPPGVKLVPVTSAIDMRKAVRDAFPRSDCVIMTAAVSDYRPARRTRGKMKKGPAKLTLDLVRNPDILAEIGRRKGCRLLIGFALETADAEKNARAKLDAKNLDYIVLNSPAAMGAVRIDAVILGRDGSRIGMRNVGKLRLARRIVALIPAK
ncbi:MAG: phosphopantothenoylcysteine decarboxylase [Planctomycetota bacterium]